MTNILKQFFGENINNFLDHHWPNQHFVSHGDLQRMPGISSIPVLQDTKHLLESLTTPVDVLGNNNSHRETIPKAIDAYHLYASGEAMIYITELHQFQEVDRLRSVLARQLDVPKRFISCEGFAASKNVNVSLHFDHETNFMVQIRGKKTWTIAKNDELPNPLHAYFACKPDRHYCDGINPDTGTPFSGTIPDHAEKFDVDAGSVTFLPRGYWHETITHEESFSIGFVIDPPTICDIAVAYLQQQLHSNPRSRKHPLYQQSNNRLKKDIYAIINDIKHHCEQLTIDDIESAYLNDSQDTARILRPIGSMYDKPVLSR